MNLCQTWKEWSKCGRGFYHFSDQRQGCKYAEKDEGRDQCTYCTESGLCNCVEAQYAAREDEK